MRNVWVVAGIGAWIAALSGCAGDTIGGSWASCPSMNWTKATVDEPSLLADLRQLEETSAVAGVKEYRDGEAAYLTVFMQAGGEFEVREKMVALGWTRVDGIPRSARTPVARN